MEDSKEIIKKIESGEVKVHGAIMRTRKLPAGKEPITKVGEKLDEKTLTPARALREKVQAEKAAFKGVAKEGEAHNKDEALAGTEAPDAQLHKDVEKVGEKVHKEAENAKAKLSGKAEKPAFPHETTINPYGFLQFGVDVMQEALGLTKTEKSPSGKAVFPETKVNIESYDPKAKTFTIKVA